MPTCVHPTPKTSVKVLSGQTVKVGASERSVDGSMISIAATVQPSVFKTPVVDSPSSYEIVVVVVKMDGTSNDQL